MVEPRQPEGQEIKITIKPVVPEGLMQGIYSNYLRVGHTTFEFVLDFAFVPPPVDFEGRRDEIIKKGEVEAPVVARIYVPKELLPQIIKALQENLRKAQELAAQLVGAEEGESE